MKGSDYKLENRLCTGHRVNRPRVEITCPECGEEYIDEASFWATCPKCDTTFARRTGKKLTDV